MALLDVLEDVGQDRDVDRLVGRVFDRVRLHVGHARMREPPRANSSIHGLASIAMTVRRCAPRRRSELALATADVEHTLALTNALDEEVVVLRQAVFCVDALVVLDRAEVDPEIRIVVHLQQLSHRALAIRLCAHSPKPEPEERPPQRVREQDPEGTQRTRRPIPPATRRSVHGRSFTSDSRAICREASRAESALRAVASRECTSAPPTGRMNIRPTTRFGYRCLRRM